MGELTSLFLLFAKIGSITFGGGYAMLPILTTEFVDNRHWVTDDELADYFAIGQCTPGIIAVNVATFIGNKRKGILGGIVSTLGLVFIPVILITIIAAFLTNFADLKIVKDAFAGIRVCVCVLIVNAVIRLWKKSVVDYKTFIVFALIFLLSVFSAFMPINISPAILVVVAAVAGILIKEIGDIKKK